MIKIRIAYEKEAAKHIQEQDKPTRQRLKIAIEKLPDGDVKRLQGYKNDYRLRVGNLRVIYSVDDDIIIVKDVLPRGQAYKRLQEVLEMSKEMLKGMIELVPDEDIETIYNVIVKFIPEDAPLPDEIEAIERANRSIAENGTISHEAINWD